MALTVIFKSGKLIRVRVRCLSCDDNCLVKIGDQEFIPIKELAVCNNVKTLGTVIFPVCPKLAIEKQKAA